MILDYTGCADVSFDDFALPSLFSGDSHMGEGSVQLRRCSRRGSVSILPGSCN